MNFYISDDGDDDGDGDDGDDDDDDLYCTVQYYYLWLKCLLRMCRSTCTSSRSVQVYHCCCDN